MHVTLVSKKLSEEVMGAMADKKKILFVDDTDSYLFLLDEILSGEYETLSSLDGEDGLEMAKLAKPDLIFLDLFMPGMSGYEVLSALKADDELKHIPVILMSAEEQVESEIQGDTLGSAGYLQKPFGPDMVLEKVNVILKGKTS